MTQRVIISWITLACASSVTDGRVWDQLASQGHEHASGLWKRHHTGGTLLYFQPALSMGNNVGWEGIGQGQTKDGRTGEQFLQSERVAGPCKWVRSGVAAAAEPDTLRPQHE